MSPWHVDSCSTACLLNSDQLAADVDFIVDGDVPEPEPEAEKEETAAEVALGKTVFLDV